MNLVRPYISYLQCNTRQVAEIFPMTDITFGNKPTSKTREDAVRTSWMKLQSRNDLALAEANACNGTLPMLFLMLSDFLENRGRPTVAKTNRLQSSLFLLTETGPPARGAATVR